MVRRMAAVVLAVTLNPTPVRAQDAVLTVTVLSADVHKGPSTVTPVIGHVSRGTVLPVSRNLGSWAKVASKIRCTCVRDLRTCVRDDDDSAGDSQVGGRAHCGAR
jgi:hypothetical protein